MELRTLLVFIGGLVITTLGGFLGLLVVYVALRNNHTMDEATGWFFIVWSVILGGLGGATITFFWWRSEVRKIRRAMKAPGC